MKFTTLIPVRRNDDSEVDPQELHGILEGFWLAFGGCTVGGRTQGYWMDGGRLYQDECLKVTVACTSDRLAEAEQMVRDIGRQLGQLAMYFEIDESAEIRILDTR